MDDPILWVWFYILWKGLYSEVSLDNEPWKLAYPLPRQRNEMVDFDE